MILDIFCGFCFFGRSATSKLSDVKNFLFLRRENVYKCVAGKKFTPGSMKLNFYHRLQMSPLPLSIWQYGGQVGVLNHFLKSVVIARDTSHNGLNEVVISKRDSVLLNRMIPV